MTGNYSPSTYKLIEGSFLVFTGIFSLSAIVQSYNTGEIPYTALFLTVSSLQGALKARHHYDEVVARESHQDNNDSPAEENLLAFGQPGR